MWYALGAVGLFSSITLILLWIKRLEGAAKAKRRLLAGGLQRSRFRDGDGPAPRGRGPCQGFGRR